MVSVEQTKKELLPMAYSNSTGNFEKMLLQFMSEEDPMLSMLKWLCEQLMEAEVTSKSGKTSQTIPICKWYPPSQ